MKKLLLISILGIFPFFAKAEECKKIDLNVGGFSHHWTSFSQYSKKNGYNEDNYGLGLTCHLNGIGNFNDEIEVGFLKNSFSETAKYVAYGIYYPVNPTIELGLRNIIASGYEKAQTNIGGMVAGPMLAAKVHINETLTLNFSGVPSISINNQHTDGFIYVNLGITLK
jgi:hypothetical protein